MRNRYSVRKFDDIYALSEFIETVNVLSKNQATKYLKNRGLNQRKIDSVLYQIKQKGIIKFSENDKFLVADPVLLEKGDYIKIYEKNIDAIWIYIDFCKKFSTICQPCKFPCKALIVNEQGKAVHIFKISSENVERDCINIDTNFSIPPAKIKPINAIIVIDDYSDIGRIYLSECVNVLAYAIIKPIDIGSVEIEYFSSSGERIRPLAN